MKSSSHSVDWQLRNCGSMISSAGSEGKSSRACSRTRHGRTLFGWPSGSAPRSKSASHRVGEHAIRATVSVGVALSNDSTTNVDELLKAADRALYRAKALGRNRASRQRILSPLGRSKIAPSCPRRLHMDDLLGLLPASKAMWVLFLAGVTTLAFALSAFACDRSGHKIVGPFLAAGA